MDSSTVISKSITSAKWLALTELLSKVSTPVIAIILARILSPVDYGVIATCMVVLSFTQIFWDTGLNRAVVQAAELAKEDIEAVFWLNIVLSIVVCLGICLLAPVLGDFFKVPEVTLPLRAMSVMVLLGGAGAVQSALLTRNMEFRQVFWRSLGGGLVPCVITVPLALHGWKVWSLVVGNLCGQAVNLAILWTFSKWRPNGTLVKKSFVRMARLGLKYVGESLAAWFFSWGDGLLVVKFLGVADLGLYRVGRSIVDLVFYTLLNPFLPIIFPAFSRLQKDPDTVNKTFKKATSLCIALCCPIGMGLLLLGPSLATLVYGQKWEGLGFVISICGLASGVSWMVGINAEVYRAMGRPEINVKIMVASILLYLAAYSLSLGGGLRWFVVARLVAAVLVIPMHVFVCSKVMKINVSYIWQHGKEAYLSTSIMAVCVLGELWLFANIGTHKISWWNAIALALSGVCVYVGCLYLTNKQFAVESLRLGRKMAS